MAVTNIVCKQLDVLTIVAVRRWHRLGGHTAKRMSGLPSPSCFAVGAHSSVSRLLYDHNDCIRGPNPKLQILSMAQRVSLPKFFNRICV
jgi:hypothetical protein